MGARHPDHRLADHPSGAAWLDAGLQVLADTPLTHLEQVSVALLMTGQARWVGIVQGGDARVQRETGLNDAEVAARPGGAPSGGASASCLTTAAFAMLREGFDRPPALRRSSTG